MKQQSLIWRGVKRFLLDFLETFSLSVFYGKKGREEMFICPFYALGWQSMGKGVIVDSGFCGGIHSRGEKGMYRIGELAKACGVKADTLRFYEKNGLISPGIRNESGYRLYSEQDKRRLEFIIRAKSVGFSLADIGELLDLDTNKAKVTCQEVKAVADTKLAQVEQKIIELTRFRDNLRELSNICCGGPRSAEHCAILETLESGVPAHHEHHNHDQHDPVHG